MEFLYNLLLFLSCLSVIYSFNGRLEERFKHYETLHQSSIKHERVKRSVHRSSNEMVVSLDTLGKHFKLHLRTVRGLFSQDFTAYAVDGHQNKKTVQIDTNDFYEGYAEGESESVVHAYWEGHDLVATIETKEDTFVVEPSWRLLPSSHSYSMISYRKSDMRQRTENDLGKSFCGYVHPDHDEADTDHFEPLQSSDTSSSEFRRRHKRQGNSATVCPVALVADYHFYEEVGSASEGTTINYMAAIISSVNNIFKSTSFGSAGGGLGMQIREVTVHTAPTTVSGGSVHYNMARTGSQWDISALLTEFSRQNWGELCLAHLFTHQAFNDGVLGLGWIASATAGTTGGICSLYSNGITYNTAWSSTQNSGGQRLTTLEANLVTAHEFGHNWGSPHDPATCVPGATSGGKYLMYQYSVNGYDDNNDVFSDCSKTTINGVLDAKKDSCFVDPDEAYCGNGIVEDDEQCDAGASGQAGLDRCCSSVCQFKVKYRCSDVNHVCCEDCSFVTAAANQQCRFTGSITASCYEDAFCSGTSYDCPDPVHKPNGTTCGDLGGCENGICKTYCERRGMVDCQCEDLTFSCKRCCKDAVTGVCSAQTDSNNEYLNHQDGKPCLIGTCNSGECERQITSLTERTWDVINLLTENGLAAFFRSNIVLTVVVLSLLIYMPFIIIILCIDWRNDKEDDELTKDWYNKESDKLVRDDDDHVIRPTYTKRRAVNYRSNRRAEDGSEVFSSRASASGVQLGEI